MRCNAGFAANRWATRTTSAPSDLSCASIAASWTWPSRSKTRAAVGTGTTYGTAHPRGADEADHLILHDSQTASTESVQPVERVLEGARDRALVHGTAPEHPVGA